MLKIYRYKVDFSHNNQHQQLRNFSSSRFTPAPPSAGTIFFSTIHDFPYNYKHEKHRNDNDLSLLNVLQLAGIAVFFCKQKRLRGGAGAGAVIDPQN